MPLRAVDLNYPLLCLTRHMGICLARSAPEFERCRAAVFWHGRFFEGLRVVDASGQTHEIVRVSIRRPATRLGQRLARLLELPISVQTEAETTAAVSVAEVRRVIEQAIHDDAESFEEFSGKDVAWWRESVEACRSVPDLMRMLLSLQADG